MPFSVSPSEPLGGVEQVVWRQRRVTLARQVVVAT
jgi:hypothetical protein